MTLNRIGYRYKYERVWKSMGYLQHKVLIMKRNIKPETSITIICWNVRNSNISEVGIVVLWVMTPCILVDGYQCSGGTHLPVFSLFVKHEEERNFLRSFTRTVVRNRTFGRKYWLVRPLERSGTHWLLVYADDDLLMETHIKKNKRKSYIWCEEGSWSRSKRREN
jgi:hypothetical protein